MKHFLLAALIWCGTIAAAFAATGTSVSWTIGKASSNIDGVADAGPVTFTWTFDRSVTWGTYVDGTPWVIWENGLKLIAVSPAETTMDVPDVGTAVAADCRLDATCINMPEDRLPLDGRMGPKYDSALVWDGTPTDLSAGDCIATGRGRRNSRSNFRHMLFTAVGVCNIVAQDMTGRYRPPIRMPARLRAALVTPRQVDVTTLPVFDVPDPRNWSGSSVNLNYGMATATWQPPDADDLNNGPQTVCGIYSHTWYEPGGAMLNHHLSGTNAGAYQRDVSTRFAACLYAALDPGAETARRQRNLDKVVQTGLDYFYQYCLGYEVWNGGGGHPAGIEGIITVTGAVLGDSTITNAMKYQRFPGHAVGRGDTVVDMFGGSYSPYARTEAAYIVAPADWRSGGFVRRTIGAGAATLDDCVIRYDLARDDLVLNNQNVPFTAVSTVDSCSAITVGDSYEWPMWARNVATAARRSFQLPPASVVRIDGDARIRKVIYFKRTETRDWTETAWNDTARGTGGVLFVYPALTAGELAALGQSGTLTTGICSRKEAQNGDVLLWESWAVMDEEQIQTGYGANPNHGYISIKLGDNLYWLPYLHLLDDPGAPGKKMHEENTGAILMEKFFRMLANNGTALWGRFAGDTNLPRTPTVQAITRHYLFNDSMSTAFCKTYDADDNMWNEEPSAVRTATAPPAADAPACPGLMARNMLLRNYPAAAVFRLDGTPVTTATPATGVYMVKFGSAAPAQAVLLYD